MSLLQVRTYLLPSEVTEASIQPCDAISGETYMVSFRSGGGYKMWGFCETKNLAEFLFPSEAADDERSTQ